MQYRQPAISRRCRPSDIIRNSALIEVEAYNNATTRDIIETILFADAHSGEFIDPVAADSCLRGATLQDTLKNVWSFVKNNIRYEADKPGYERVKSPGALMAVGKGDCKSFSIMEGALLRALGIPYRYRFAAYEPGDYTHVYVIAETPGGDVVLDAVHSKPFQEVSYMKKKDYSPRPVSPAVAGLPYEYYTEETPGVQGFTLSLPLVLLLVAGGYLLLNTKRK